MARITLFKQGARSVRAECERVAQQDSHAIYNTTGLAYVEDYDGVEYVTSAGIYLRQDDAGECKLARDAYDTKQRAIKDAVAAATADAVPAN